MFWYFYFILIFEWISLGDSFGTLVISSAILLPIETPVAYDFFLITLFEAVFIAFVADVLALSRSFWPYSLLNFLPMFLAREKNPYPFKYILSLGSVEYLIFIMVVLFN